MKRSQDSDGKPPVQSLFQRMERIEAEMDSSAHTGHNRWIIPYADLLTLLLGLFLVIFTSGQADTQAKTPAKKPAPVVAIKPQESTEHQLANHLQQTFQVKGVEITQQERGLVISLKDSILFAPGSAALSASAKETLDRLSHELQTSMGKTPRPIRVEGHTDDTPIQTSQFPSNWELSTARATNIVRYLVSSHHFSPERLSAAGYGEFKPLKDNSTIEGKQKNRRVDIVVLSAQVANQEPPVLTKSRG